MIRHASPATAAALVLLMAGVSACSPAAKAEKASDAPSTPTAANTMAAVSTDPKPAGVAAYCRANGTVDAPPDKAVPSDENGAPLELAAMGATKFRCLQGEALVCADSADGDQCSRKDASRTPPELADACTDMPDLDRLPNAATHFSRFDWRCKAGKPVILKEYALDGRGFLQKAWAKLVVKEGKVVGPAQAPEIVR